MRPILLQERNRLPVLTPRNLQPGGRGPEGRRLKDGRLPEPAMQEVTTCHFGVQWSPTERPEPLGSQISQPFCAAPFSKALRLPASSVMRRPARAPLKLRAAKKVASPSTCGFLSSSDDSGDASGDSFLLFSRISLQVSMQEGLRIRTKVDIIGLPLERQYMGPLAHSIFVNFLRRSSKESSVSVVLHSITSAQSLAWMRPSISTLANEEKAEAEAKDKGRREEV
jgi:hypothetical protein